MGMIFLNSIKQIAIFMICAQAVIYLKKTDSYEKYLKFLVGIFILIQVILPIFSFFSKYDSEEFHNQVLKYTYEMETNLSKVEFIETVSEEKIQELMLEELRRQQKNQDINHIEIQYVEVSSNGLETQPNF